MINLFGPDKETKFNRTEELIIDNIFLNLQDHTKLNFRNESRFKNDIKNYPVNGERLTFDFIVEKIHSLEFVIAKYFVKNKYDWECFLEEFGAKAGSPERVDFPITYIYAVASHAKPGDKYRYSAGGFIVETTGMEYDQLKDLLLKKIKENDIINKVLERCK